MMADTGIVLVTGFEPFGPHGVNPSAELAKAVDGQTVGDARVCAAVLPVHHADTGPAVARLIAQIDPSAILHLGLAAGRARVAVERVAVNVMDYELPDAAGYQAAGEPCVPGGPAAYLSTLPVRAIAAALVAEGIPGYVSSTAGTYLCNQTLYGTLHGLAARGRRTPAGFLHFPLLPSMVAAAGLEQPSMDFALMRRAVEVTLRVVTAHASSGP
jgi:pyroglutamyl-peptidase